MPYFNSTLVRLKVNDIWRAVKTDADFNSTLVRLKDDNIERIKFDVKIFQFHFGTIESFEQAKHKSPQGISIPLWYD